MLTLTHIKEGLRMFKRARSIKKYGLPRYPGDDREICIQILEQCYHKEKKYFQVSAGHFCEFYTRDFGWICEALLSLGYKTKVKHTLEYALQKFSKHGRVRTSISPKGQVFDFPIYAVDSLAYLLHCLALLNNKELVAQYKSFLESELDYFFVTVVDTTTGLVRKDKFFSSMKDYSKRKSSCYDNCMLYLVQQSCKKLGLSSGLEKYDYSTLLLDHFWTGTHFLDDLSGKKYVAGDAQVFPFWTGVITDKKILKKVIGIVQKHSLDTPLPMRYTHEDTTEIDTHTIEIFAKDYERHVTWTHMGPLWVQVVGKVDKTLQQKYLEQYKHMILKYSNFLEVLTPYGNPYSTTFYYTDDSMSWCANYLFLQSP